MEIKIYAGEKLVFLGSQPPARLSAAMKKSHVLQFGKDVKAADVLSELAKPGNDAARITADDVAMLKNNFFKQFKIIEAAGGIVQNEKKEILFIFRRGKWDLPKGKKDKGESPEICAEREIEEETGVKNLTRKSKAGETYHIYSERGKNILKLTHWFYFTCSGLQETAPQLEEDITEVRWFATQNIREPMADTYGNIRDIMHAFFDAP